MSNTPNTTPGEIMNCGECLMRDVAMVPLVEGVCPKCGTDYTDVTGDKPDPQRFWRTWDELTDGERFDIMHAENPPALATATGNLWRVTSDGWECADRSACKASEIYGCR